jgi:NDP-sugar pyrophosphorylase family protein
VTVAGRTLLEITLERLRECGIREVIVNAHHFATMIDEYLKANDGFGMRIELSRERELLDTGGGLKKAAHFFSTSQQEPFLVHNVDVLSTIDLRRMMQFHVEKKALATLAVHDREAEWARPAAEAQPLGFCGIQILSPRIFAQMNEEGAFSIIATYMKLAAQGERIVAYRADDFYWRDLGRPESIAQAEQDVSSGRCGLAASL